MQLRDGPLDKHGGGSRILDATAHVDQTEIARFAEFGKDRQDPSGGSERGLTAQEITTYMDANFERAKATRRWIDRQLMDGEWPVLLNIMGKGEGEERYLSVAEVRTLFVERRLPERIAARLPAAAPAQQSPLRLGKIVLGLVAFAGVVFISDGRISRSDAENPAGQDRANSAASSAGPRSGQSQPYWLDQNWSTEDRHWFHHASQGTATFPVPYDWFMALEQPGLHLFSQPGLLSDSGLSRTVRFPAKPEIRPYRSGEPAPLRLFGHVQCSAGTGIRRQVCGRRRSKISTACRSVSRA